jgi:hypothetical protein
MPRIDSDPSEMGITTEAEEQLRLNAFSLTLDENERVPSGLKRFETRVSEECLTSEMISTAHRDCIRLYESDAEDMDASFWMPAAATPCSDLEFLAQNIFQAHTAGVSFELSTR